MDAKHKPNPLPEETVRLPKDEPLGDFVERRIQQAMAEGGFDHLSGKGKPLPSLHEPYHEAWWVKQLCQREKFSTAEMELRIQIDRVRESIEQGTDSDRLRQCLNELNSLIVRLNRMGPSAIPSAYATVDVESTLQRLLQEKSQPNR